MSHSPLWRPGSISKAIPDFKEAWTELRLFSRRTEDERLAPVTRSLPTQRNRHENKSNSSLSLTHSLARPPLLRHLSFLPPRHVLRSPVTHQLDEEHTYNPRTLSLLVAWCFF
jgi:hypothetical protein